MEKYEVMHFGSIQWLACIAISASAEFLVTKMKARKLEKGDQWRL